MKKQQPPAILLAEDDQTLRRLFCLELERRNCRVKSVGDGHSAIALLKKWQPDVIITDLMMEPGSGMELLAWAGKYTPEIPCIILTAFGTVETAVKAMRNGAFDFLTKPVDHASLFRTVEEALSLRATQPPPVTMVGSSQAMQQLQQEIALLAAVEAPVLILGESGTGKDLAARSLHRLSPVREGDFIRINCASIPADLLESTLFGHTKGAFTGAEKAREGAFRAADGGVLFLDEIGDLPLALQPRLLHAVESGEVVPVGTSRAVAVRVKIVSATNRDLEQMVADKSFRADLFYRLNAHTLTLPPLRRRGGDIAELAHHFLQRSAGKYGSPVQAVSPETLTLLQQAPWPGNIRQLSSVINDCVLRCTEPLLQPEHLPEALHTTPQPLTPPDAPLELAAQERQSLLTALAACHWNQTRAAEMLGITRNTLRYRQKKYNLRPESSSV